VFANLHHHPAKKPQKQAPIHTSVAGIPQSTGKKMDFSIQVHRPCDYLLSDCNTKKWQHSGERAMSMSPKASIPGAE
jgi:hypothetical protein